MGGFRRDAAGNLLRLGRVEQAVSWVPMISATLPSWLTAPVGTYAGQTATSSTAPANGKITSAAPGGAMRLLGPQFIPDRYAEVEFAIYGLKFDTSAGWNFRYELGETGQDRGVQLRHDDSGTNESYAVLRGITSAGVYTDHATYYQHQKPNGVSQSPRNISLLWRPNEAEVFVLEDDQVMAYADVSGDAINKTSAARPVCTMEVTDAGTHWFAFNRVDLILRHN